VHHERNPGIFYVGRSNLRIGPYFKSYLSESTVMEPLNETQGGQTLRFCLLGVPEMIFQQETFTLPRRQARALLFRLAVDGQSVPREELADLLWPDKSPAAARRNLTRLLSYLRGQLPGLDLLQTNITAVSLNPMLVASDVIQFTQLCQLDNSAGWETAVSLYRGPFLSGFSLNENPVFDHWQSRELGRLERLYLEALRRLTLANFQQPAKAIQFANKYLSTDDLAEDIHRQLITLYAANGDRSAALRQYEDCVIILERELGVPPLPETRAAYEAARDNRQFSASDIVPEPEWATLPGLDLPLIGRGTAWEALETSYARFQRGGVIFIAGEPGVGKSRLMQEFASTQAGLVLTGNSHADGRTIPYQPLIQALRQALTLRARWRHAAPIWLAEASRLMPELPAKFPNLPPLVEVEAQQAQSRLFEALTQVFLSLASDTPLLLCLDDVHWADEATLGWLQNVSLRLAASNLCILATYRSNEAASLREWRRALDRKRLKAEVKLDGLSETAVLSLLRRTSDDIVAPELLAARLHAATGGNAFFVLETLRELLETGQLADLPTDLPLPSTVREAVLRRAGRLTPLAQQILEITAVLSPLLTFPIIQQTAGRGNLEAAANMEELIAHQLLRAADDQFHFQHELAREAVYLNISSWRRRILHRRAANALLTLPNQEDAGLAAAIASHFEGADEMEQAIDYYFQAATAAQALYAHQESISHLNHAIELATEKSVNKALLLKLHEALADNLTITGEFASAEVGYQEALAFAAGSEPLKLADLERKLAATLGPQQRLEESESAYLRALTHLDESPPAAEAPEWQSTRLNILLGLLDDLYFQIRPGAMAELNEQAQALLDTVGTDEQKSIFYSRLDQMSFLQNRYRVNAENVVFAQSALAYAQESGGTRLIARRQFSLGFTLLWCGRLDDAVKMLREALTTARELGDKWFQNLCLVYLTILFRFQGNISEVTDYLSQLVEISEQVGNSMYIGVSQANTAWLHYRAGEWVQAQAHAEAAIANWTKTPYPFQWLAHWPLLAIALRENWLSEAAAAARAMLDAKQQQLPDVVDDVLRTAVSAWEADEKTAVRAHLKTAVEIASQYGYL
jgi:DNA-binding SARP family transcriptional activator